MLTTESPGRRRWRLLWAGLIGLLVSSLAATACDDHADRTSQSTQRLAPTTQASAPVAHSSWPTSGWRTAAPQDHGINPSVLAGIDDQAKTAFPGLRSVLVVRHGYLVVERYYHGSNATEYHNVFSVTKSVTSALSASLWATTSSRACTRPSASSSAGTCPPTPIPPWPRSRSSNC